MPTNEWHFSVGRGGSIAVTISRFLLPDTLNSHVITLSSKLRTTFRFSNTSQLITILRSVARKLPSCRMLTQTLFVGDIFPPLKSARLTTCHVITNGIAVIRKNHETNGKYGQCQRGRSRPLRQFLDVQALPATTIFRKPLFQVSFLRSLQESTIILVHDDLIPFIHQHGHHKPNATPSRIILQANRLSKSQRHSRWHLPTRQRL